MINSVCGVGSTGRICTDLYDVFTKEGHECCIAYGRGTAPANYETYKIGNEIDNYWHVFETRFFDNHGFASRKATKKFLDFVRTFKPDIIHLHNIHGYYLNVKLLFNYLNNEFKGKIYWTFHDQWAFSSHEAYIFENQKDKKRLLEYPKSYISLHENLKRKENLFLSNENMVIISPSHWLAESARASFFKNTPIVVINNGIDLKKFEPASFSHLEEKYDLKDKKIILAVSNIWDSRKGLNHIEQLSDLLDDSYQIVVIGNVKQKIDKILYIDKTESIDELISWYSFATFFVNPTMMENFPTVNIEALACGTPVITFDTGGSPEIIDEYSGAVTSKKTAESIAYEIKKKRVFEKENCVDRAARFSKRSMVFGYLNLFQTGKSAL